MGINIQEIPIEIHKKYKPTEIIMPKLIYYSNYISKLYILKMCHHGALVGAIV